MKILVPVSSGINSVYALYRYLSETGHEVIALHFKEPEADESARFELIRQWLHNNVREFRTVYHTQREATERKLPIRAGFKTLISQRQVQLRYETYGAMAQKLRCDAVAIGIALENTSTDRHPMYVGQVYRAGVQVFIPAHSLLTPVAHDMPYDDLAANMKGRFEQREFLPEDLQSLLIKCSCDACARCDYEGARHRFESGKEYDTWLAMKGQYGPWRHLADPETYTWRNNNLDLVRTMVFKPTREERLWNIRKDHFRQCGLDLGSMSADEFVEQLYDKAYLKGIELGVFTGDENRCMPTLNRDFDARLAYVIKEHLDGSF